MRITCLLFGLSLLLAYVHANPIVKRETEPVELNPLNEVRRILEFSVSKPGEGEGLGLRSHEKRDVPNDVP